MLFRPFRAYYFSFYSMELHSMLVISPLQGLLLFFILQHGASLHACYLRPFRAYYYFSFYSMELHSMLVICALSELIFIFHFTAGSFTPCWLFMPFQGLLLFFILPHGASLHSGYLCSFSVYYCSIKNTL